jgi:hypothetical protein
MVASAVGATGLSLPLVDFVGDAGPSPIPAGLLDRVMYLGSPTTGRDGSRLVATTTGPQAHLAIQGAATDPLPPHFHGVDQFQVFVNGSGTVGGHAVGPGIVHYADRNSVYGPLRPGPNGMAYATLRAEHDPGAAFMPGARAELAERLRGRPGPRRNLTVALDPTAELDTSVPADGWRDAVADEDGLRIAVCAARAGAVVPVGVGPAGAYLAVLDGNVAAAGKGAIAWCAPGAHTIVAGEDGAILVLLQFPEPSGHVPTMSDT